MKKNSMPHLKSLVLALLFLLGFITPQKTNAQYVNIPDPIFKAWVLTNVPHSSSPTDITPVEASNYRGGIYVDSLGISNLTGIESFVNIDSLVCPNNRFASLDVTKNTLLTYLDCGSNPIYSLDVSNNKNLSYLDCSGNGLNILDVSQNLYLKYLNCGERWNASNNFITSLDLSRNSLLTYLNCSSNYYLANFDLSKNTKLSYLDCSSDFLGALDISKNLELTYLDCNNNGIDSFDITNNVKLNYLNIGNNTMSKIDLSKNKALTSLFCESSSINSLDVSKNLSLKDLRCNFHNLTNLNVHNNTLLTHLECCCGVLGLDSLDVSKNILLSYLDGSNNLKIKSMDLSPNKSLKVVDFGYNNLQEFNLKNGADTLITSLNLKLNRLLSCVQVDNWVYAVSNWTSNVDTQTKFSTYCWPLPVTLVSFEVSNNSGNSIIKWTTANEVNTDKFAIQRSNNGSDFYVVGTVLAKGTSNSHYSFVDGEPIAAPFVYYRLQMIDKDGSHTYSKVVKLSLPQSGSPISISPNPARNSTTLGFNSTIVKGTVSIYSTEGKKLLAENIANANAYLLNTQHFTNGLYMVEVNTGSNIYKAKMIVAK